MHILKKFCNYWYSKNLFVINTETINYTIRY